MKALVLKEYNKFEYIDVDNPVPGPGEVLIRVKACGVCGSDVHGMDGSSGRRKPPIIMGHEAAGIIAQCGEGVEQFKPGDRVTFDSTVYCNDCEECRRGNINLCSKRKVLGVSCSEYRMDGAFAEYVKVPAYILYSIPDEVSYVQATMAEPLSVAYHAAARFTVPEGGIVLVVGAGTIGLLLIQVLKSMGAKTVIAADIDDAQLSKALNNGASYCINSGAPDSVDKILKLTDNQQGVDAAYDAAGIEMTVNLCLHATRCNGKAVLIGNLSKMTAFPLQWLVTRQQSVFGSCASAGEYEKSLKLIAEGKVFVDDIISKVVPLAEGDKWITSVYYQEPGLHKLVLEP